MTIKEFRQAQGLSQTRLAEALGIGVSTVGGYETGRINPSEKVVARIRELFNVDLSAPAGKPAEAKPVKRAEAKRPVKAAPKKAAPKKAASKKAAEKAAPKKTAEKAAPTVIIQSPMGGEITAADILARVGDVDKVYVRVDQNAAYWVRGDESGAVNLW